MTATIAFAAGTAFGIALMLVLWKWVEAPMERTTARIWERLMTDLTTITTPFGLLDRETQEALKAHGGPWETYYNDGWKENRQPYWANDVAYRVKPAPIPREFWLHVEGGISLPSGRSRPDGNWVLCREVLE